MASKLYHVLMPHILNIQQAIIAQTKGLDTLATELDEISMALMNHENSNWEASKEARPPMPRRRE